MIEQLLGQLRSKVRDSKQLALVDGAPTLLIIGRNMYGANDLAAAEAVRLCFQGEFENLSGFVSSENWKFTKMGFFQTKRANVIFDEGEIQTLEHWAM